MSIRDISEIKKLIKFKISHGLDLDKSLFKVRRKTKHKNFIFQVVLILYMSF